MKRINISARDRYLYTLALRIAEDSDCSDKHGTVITRGGVIACVATNRFIGNPTSARWLKRTIHSEQRALLRIGSAAKGATLYTARLHSNLQSAPCLMCRSLLEEAGIARIVYHTGMALIKERI